MAGLDSGVCEVEPHCRAGDSVGVDLVVCGRLVALVGAEHPPHEQIPQLHVVVIVLGLWDVCVCVCGCVFVCVALGFVKLNLTVGPETA